MKIVNVAEPVSISSRCLDLLERAPLWARASALLERLYLHHYSKKKARARALIPFIQAGESTRRPRIVLVVCKGNICRSPFLAGYLNKICPEESISFISAGLRSRGDAVVPQEAIETAAEFRVDLSEHRARGLKGADAESADLVVGMEPIHHIEFCLRFPESRRKFLLLRILEDSPPSLSLSDPFGHGPKVFRDCFELLVKDGEILLSAILSANGMGLERHDSARHRSILLRSSDRSGERSETA